MDGLTDMEEKYAKHYRRMTMTQLVSILASQAAKDTILRGHQYNTQYVICAYCKNKNYACNCKKNLYTGEIIHD